MHLSRTVIAGMGGALAANVVPHLGHALARESFPTPFASPPGVGLSSPRQNYAWSAMNVAAASAAFAFAFRRPRPLGAAPRLALAAGLGAMTAGVLLADYFGRRVPLARREGGTTT